MANKIKWASTVSRDGFGSEYDDSDSTQQEIAEQAYERAAQNVMEKMYPGAEIEIDITFRESGLDDESTIWIDGAEYDGQDEGEWPGAGRTDEALDFYRVVEGDIWSEMCDTTWAQVTQEREAA